MTAKEPACSRSGLETAATEDELAAEAAAVRTQKRPSRKPFPDHLGRERIVIAARPLTV
jgi:hypothetical protein